MLKDTLDRLLQGEMPDPDGGPPLSVATRRMARRGVIVIVPPMHPIFIPGIRGFRMSIVVDVEMLRETGLVTQIPGTRTPRVSAIPISPPAHSSTTM